MSKSMVSKNQKKVFLNFNSFLPHRLTDFLNFTSANGIPVDFVSTHEYPTDIQPTYRNVMHNGKLNYIISL